MKRFWIVPAFVVGLALHNLVMSLLYGAGVRGRALTAIEAWKELLLGGALAWFAVQAVRRRSLPFRPNGVDVLALAFGAVVLLYALIPQNALGGEADASGVAHGVRHHLLFVGAYFLGRCLGALPGWTSWWFLGAAAAVGAFGLVEEYAVSLDWWRRSGAKGWFQHQLGFDYKGLSGLPENFVYNFGNDVIARRLVSTFLSPLATAYMLCVALLLAAAMRTRRALPLAAVAAVALLWTYSRSTWIALVVGLLVLAAAQRRVWPVVAAALAVAVFAGYSTAFRTVAPRAHFTQGGARRPARDGQGAADAADGRRRRLDAQPLAQPRRRAAARRRAPAGLRRRQLRLDGRALRCRREGGRVDLHRARRRHRRRRAGAVRRAQPRPPAAAPLPLDVARRVARGRARAGRPDRRARRAVARVLPLARRRRRVRYTCEINYLPDTTRVGPVALTVADLGRSLDFYRRAIGLDVLEQGGGEARLGAGSVELLRLSELPGAQPSLHETGLYHFALLLPDRASLARWLAHAARDRVQLTGLSDHAVSEAIYLDDPDRHGIEIYADRPREQWDGRVLELMTTRPLDVAACSASSTTRRTSRSTACRPGRRWATCTCGSRTSRRRPPSTATGSGSS